MTTSTNTSTNTSTTPVVRMTQFIRGPREKVFAAWIKPEFATKWFSPEELTPVSFEADVRVGGHYKHVMKSDTETYVTVGTYREIIPNEKLVFTWGADTPEPPESVVTIELVDKDGGTELTLTHEKLPPDLVKSHEEGWTSALRHLAKRIDTF